MAERYYDGRGVDSPDAVGRLQGELKEILPSTKSSENGFYLPLTITDSFCYVAHFRLFQALENILAVFSSDCIKNCSSQAR